MSTDTPKDEFPELEDAFDLWREDVARTASRIDVHGALADRVVAAARQRAPLRAIGGSAARWYAAAAVLLIGIGVAGTLLARSRTHDEPTPIGRWATLDEELMQALASDPDFEPGLGR